MGKGPLSATFMAFYTQSAASMAVQAQRAVAYFDTDELAEPRKEEVVCKACFYLRSQRVVGQAFTGWQCGVCGTEAMHHNTGVPRVCMTCAKAHSLCTRCGGDLNMDTKRTEWPITPSPGAVDE